MYYESCNLIMSYLKHLEQTEDRQPRLQAQALSDGGVVATIHRE